MNTFNDSLSSYVNYHRHDALEIGFNKAKTQQAACFREIDNKCSVLEDSITYLQKTIVHLQMKISEYSENNQSVKLDELKEKQKQFIILELQKKAKRLQTNQQSLHSSLMQKQMQICELKDKNYELTIQNTQIKEQNIKKAKQIKQLIKTNSTLKLAQSLNQKKQVPASPPVHTPNISQIGMKKQQIFNRNQNYEELESKLKELENYFNGEVQHYKVKNGKLEKEIKRLNQELQKQSLNIKRIYQLQLRVKNLTSENHSLEESYTSQLTTMNENEVKFHKKTNELKNQIHELKRAHKNEYKQYEKELKKFSSHVLGASDKATIFIGVEGIRDQLQQLGKQILKWHNKQIKSVCFEKDSIIEDLQLNMESSKNKIIELSNTIQKMKVRKTEIIQKSPLLNGHSIVNKSNSQNNVQPKEKQKINERVIEQKYEQKIKQITAQLDEKQKQINEMRKKYDEIGTEMGRKQLQLQTKITQKQMQLQYQEQNMSVLKSNSLEAQKNRRNQAQKQIKKIKDKIKQIETQREQFKNKYKQSEQKLQSKERLGKEMERKQKQMSERIKKIEKRNETKVEELKKMIETKDKNIKQLICKNQTITMDLKLARQRLRITQFSLNSFKNQSSQNSNEQKQAQAKQIQSQLFLQKQQLETQMIIKQQENQSLKEENEQKNETIRKKQEKVNELNQHINRIDNDLKLLRNQNQLLKQNSQKLKQSSQKLNSFAQLRQQYQKREKILKAEGEKIIMEMKNSKKQVQAQNKKLNDQLNGLKSQNSQIKTQINQYEQQKLKFNAQKFKDSERQRKIVKNYEQKISLLSSKLSQLNKDSDKKLNPANSPSRIKNAGIKNLKKTDSTEFVQSGMMTEKLSKNDQGINTVDLFSLQTQNNGQMNKILDLNDEPQEQVSRNSNLFMNLKGNAPNDDFFEICDQNEVVNFGESQLKLQVRELFTNLRIQIEKLFNQDQISFATTKLLPQGLQDDYYQLMSYIKQKIAQIKAQVEISFIMAEPGNEPEPQLDNSLQLPAFIQRHASEGVGESLKKIIEQKEALINSLMNERTSQENTINQLTVEKQEIQEQNQNRFMNQCNVYKKQIKEHKKTIDKFEMNMQSMKIVLRNILEAYSENQDMEDDFRESMNLYAKVSGLSQKERSRINYYIQRYLEIKGLDTAF